MSKQLEKLPVLQDVEIMSERIICVRGRNSGTFTLQGTNTYIVGSGRERLIIDTGDGNEGWILSVKNVLRKHHISITMVLLTHWHGDHTGGVPDLLKINPTLEGSIWKMDPDKGQQPILNGQIFHVEGATVQAIYTPGHSHDHMCFRLEDENALFTGDTILGHGSTAIEDLGAYTESLKKMQDLRCTDGYPGHGAHIDNLPGKISAELNQKLRREKSVLDALRKVHSTSGDISGIGRGLNVQELVVTMYGNIDEQLREKVLKPSVEQVLEKLMAEERVGWRIRGQEKGWFVVEV
ncbi:metallo-beta-lactamase superfamily protein [Delitschia confertaspora ATCC 74209]|uniref:Metallo-beta-lactamase superfamily protein n=1 Tax=Delitschia confertaspora ATCC 74209 TaxID=1513339 RepID=A0A9P4MT08_9PLEO|nr:metallo-beta-lactamase superfamily protein [Delitschia confertaspora ATCC 74209]